MKFASVNPKHIVGPLRKESGLNWTIMERIWPFTLFTVKVLAEIPVSTPHSFPLPSSDICGLIIYCSNISFLVKKIITENF